MKNNKHSEQDVILNGEKVRLKQPGDFKTKWKSKSIVSRSLWSLVGGRAIAEKTASIKEKGIFIGGMFSGLFHSIKEFYFFTKDTILLLFGKKKAEKHNDKSGAELNDVEVVDEKAVSKGLMWLIVLLLIFFFFGVFKYFGSSGNISFIDLFYPVVVLSGIIWSVLWVLRQEKEFKSDSELIIHRLERNAFFLKVVLSLAWLVWTVSQVKSLMIDNTLSVFSIFTFTLSGFTFYVLTYVKKVKIGIHRIRNEVS